MSYWTAVKRIHGGVLRSLIEGDAVTKALELGDEPVALTIGVAAGEVVPAEVVVAAVGGQ